VAAEAAPILEVMNLALPSDEPVRTRFAPGRPVDVRTTLQPLKRGAGDPTMRVDATGTWRTILTPAGPATLHLAQHQSHVECAAWGAGAEWAIESVPELLGQGDDWSDFDVSALPFAAEAQRQNPGLRLTRTKLVFEALVMAILEQKITGIEAKRGWRILVTKYGSPASGPVPAGMRVVPTPQEWAQIPSWEWHRAGVGPQRSATVMRATKVAASLERTADWGRGGARVESALRSVVGVGVWTAAETMQRAHADPDSPSVGDYHLAAVVGWALIGEPVDDDRMLELLEPWRGHRQRVVRLITASGFRKPAFGPRMTIQDHRGH
jgi:3-methyladenine DNA glycosylase/8-oxoguanine DNA glycosylase